MSNLYSYSHDGAILCLRTVEWIKQTIIPPRQNLLGGLSDLWPNIANRIRLMVFFSDGMFIEVYISCCASNDCQKKLYYSPAFIRMAQG
jgi:hypothetical protein